MPVKESYNDLFRGVADEGFDRIFRAIDEEDRRTKLKKILLKVIKNELSPRQKEIIMLYYFKRENTVEISHRLGISQQSVSKTLSRARLNLLKILKYYI